MSFLTQKTDSKKNPKIAMIPDEKIPWPAIVGTSRESSCKKNVVFTMALA